MQTHIDQTFRDLSSTAWNPAWLSPLRSAAFAAFQRLGWPQRKDENWRYTNAKALAQTRFSWSDERPREARAYGDFLLADAYQLVFINGVFAPEASTLPAGPELTVLPMAEALQQRHPLLESLLTATPRAARSSLEQLNLACFTGGSLIHLQAQTRLDRPLQLLHVNTASSSPETAQLINPRHLVVLEAGSEAVVVESYFSYLETNFTNIVSEYQVKAGAQLQVLSEKILSSTSLHVHHQRFVLDRDAQLKSFNLSLGGQLARTQQQIELREAGASAQFDGLYVGRQRSHIDSYTEVSHLAPYTQSSQVFKGILYDQSRAVFDGRIVIAKDAQQTQAQQLNKNLLMSDEAEVDTKPQLQIDANDVRCAHGATVGRLDRNEIFYLMSRGISREEGEQILSKAFIRDVLGRIKQSSLEQRLEQLLVRYGGIDNYV